MGEVRDNALYDSEELGRQILFVDFASRDPFSNRPLSEPVTLHEMSDELK